MKHLQKKLNIKLCKVATINFQLEILKDVYLGLKKHFLFLKQRRHKSDRTKLG